MLMLTHAGVREQKEGAEARDVLNEKPQNEFLAAATTAKASNLGKGAGRALRSALVEP
jgi:hypothetical protein